MVFHVVFLAALQTSYAECQTDFITFTADAECQTDNIYTFTADADCQTDNVYASTAANAALSAECLYHDAVKLKFYTGMKFL